MTTIGPAAAPRRRGKIVCTLGPATAAPDRVAALVAAGMDVARLNFSHGDHADHEKVHRAVREAAERAGRVVGVLADLQGPKIRLGRFTDGPVHWPAGTTVRITVEDVPGTPERVSTTYAALAADAKPGDRLARLHPRQPLVALTPVREMRDQATSSSSSRVHRPTRSA